MNKCDNIFYIEKTSLQHHDFNSIRFDHNLLANLKHSMSLNDSLFAINDDSINSDSVVLELSGEKIHEKHMHFHEAS